MSDPTNQPNKAWLIALAARREFDAVAQALGCRLRAGDPGAGYWERVGVSGLGDVGVDLVWTGVGKANACGAVGRVLDSDRHIGVLSAGIAGALPADSGCCACQVLDVVCARESVFADEGVQTPDGFESLAKMGFPLFDDGTDLIAHPKESLDWLDRFSDVSGAVACVSVCSGTDAQSRAVAARTGAIAEAMEGAAIGLGARRVDRRILTGELRVISNTTGARGSQRWDLDGAMDRLGEVIGQAVGAL